MRGEGEEEGRRGISIHLNDLFLRITRCSHGKNGDKIVCNCKSQTLLPTEKKTVNSENYSMRLIVEVESPSSI